MSVFLKEETENDIQNVKILVIIVTYNGIKWITKVLQSIRTSILPVDTFVIDNGSSDGTQDYIKKNFPDVFFFQNTKNQGFGVANNIGLKYVIDNDYDYAYLLNQDAWIFPNTLCELVSIHKHYPEYGILSPLQIQANMYHLDKNFLCGVCSSISNPSMVEDLIFQRRQAVYSVPRVMAAHWLISRECLEKVGGFSPTFPHYGEDDNYADRAIFHGFKVGVVLQCKAVHDREFRITTNQKNIYMWYIRWLIVLSEITHSPENFLLLKILYSCLKQIIKYKSPLPFGYVLKLVTNWHFIHKNKDLSKKGCSFFPNDNFLFSEKK